MKRKLMFLGIVILVAILATGVTFFFFLDDYNENVQLKNHSNEEIVLVNIGNGNRIYIAEILDKLNHCKPKVIGLDVTFSTLKDSVSDITLRNSILESHAVLAYQFRNRTQQFFLNNAKYGIAESLYDDDEFMSKWKISYKNMNHFAYEVAHSYNKALSETYFEKHNNKTLPIVFSYLPKHFKTYSYRDLDFDCADISEKIVLLGYLGPDNEDKKRTYLRYELGIREPSDTYGLVIIANQVAMILDDISPGKVF